MVMKVEKVIAALPGTLDPNTVYLVRAGAGFDIRVTDQTGSTAHVLNTEGGVSGPIGPAFTYTNGALTRIDYDNGSFKVFTYTDGVLTQLDFVVGGVTTRKTFNYTGDLLTSIDQETI
jgi:hypothetical protein